MGFTRDYDKVKSKFEGFSPEVVYKFWQHSLNVVPLSLKF
jgi:hypothetical protein